MPGEAACEMGIVTDVELREMLYYLERNEYRDPVFHSGDTNESRAWDLARRAITPHLPRHELGRVFKDLFTWLPLIFLRT